ncbi:MAG: helix-turn-helix domain-containing protein, partial [Candidatus Omnitrophica bacterium]|nr:helix-turn-helix domain-containing protein [Candidatus Omnitrophota bacterium]
QKMVADNFGISLLDIKTRRRNKNIVFPRQVAMYISRELTEFSLSEIGEFFGGKDHTTVLHAYNKIKEHINRDADLRGKIQKLIKDITQ